MNVWKNLTVCIVSLFLCAAVLAQETHAKAPPSGPTVLVNGVSEPVYRVRDGVKPPRIVYSPEPYFSDEVDRRKIQGAVTLDVVVTSAGKPTLIRVIQGLGDGLDEKAIETVSKWKFRPATKDGAPVSVEIAVQVDFHVYQRP
jgi:TonB family protein